MRDIVDASLWHRFWAKVEFGPGCWRWRAATNSKGYGNIKIDGRAVTAHRVAWYWFCGPIPNRLMVLHHCDNPGCVNPEHLFTGTATDNARDSVAKGRHPGTHKTHCPKGHPYSGDNLVIRTKPNGRTQRLCRECERSRCRKYQAKRRAAERRVRQ